MRYPLLAATLGILAVAASGFGQGFDPGCPLPFEAIKAHHPIDDTCQARGDAPDPPAPASNDAAHALQNEAKNSFCRSGTAALVTFWSFSQLQKKLDQKVPVAAHWNREHLPNDRSVLASLYTTTEGATVGEGSVVHLAGWLMKLRKGNAESCNCEGTKKDETDMHLVLISSSDRENTPECSSVTAEISPHFRPDVWDGQELLAANAHPLRFTGQLFYDAAHRPCSGSPAQPGASAPARVSSWEIHPVYGIDVCKKRSLRSCKADDESAWTPLDKWPGDQ